MLSFRYVIGDFFPLGILFAMLGTISVRKNVESFSYLYGIEKQGAVMF